MILRKLILGYTSYRQETIPFVQDKMLEYQCVALEEPPTPGFEEMLRLEMNIEDYLMLTDFGFPEFARKQCRLLQNLHSRNIAVIQVDPFLEELACIHEFFASGGSPHEIETGTRVRQVYDCERDWTAKLVDFYEKALSSDFSSVIRAVQEFARADSRKGRFRDVLRAQALENLFSRYEKLYVEAGYIHFVLLRELRKRLPADARLLTFYSLQDYFMSRIGKRQIMGPGDVLTLIYTWNYDYSGPRANLLAARSLIYNKLIQKHELEAGVSDFPQSNDEIRAVSLSGSLDLEQCARLYPQIKNLSAHNACEAVQIYLNRSRH